MQQQIKKIVILTGLFISMITVKAQNPIGAATLGIGLDIFANKIHEAIERATGAGLILEVNAGGEVAQAISQIKQAYEKELNKTWADLGTEEQQALNALNSTINSFLNKTYSKISEIEDQAQAIIHIIPFSKNLPMVINSSPVFIIQNGINSTVSFVLKGDFYDMARKNFDATAIVNGKQYKNVTNNENQISFEIPAKDFNRNANNIVANYITVQIPFQKTKVLLFKKRELAEFKFAIGCLPLSPGTLTITTTTNQPDVEVRRFHSPHFSQESNDDDIKCGGEHADLAIHKCYPDAGWRVRPNTVTYEWWQGPQGHEGRGGDYWLESNCSTASEACLCWSTEHHRAGTSGKVYFNIVFDEERDIMTAHSADNKIEVSWNESKTFDVPAGATWKAKYVQFDGKLIEFTGPLTDNPYLQILSTPSSTGQTLTIAAIN